MQSIALLRDADSKIKTDMDILFEDKEALEYVLDAKKTRSIIDTELLNARHNFEFRDNTKQRRVPSKDQSG